MWVLCCPSIWRQFPFWLKLIKWQWFVLLTMEVPPSSCVGEQFQAAVVYSMWLCQKLHHIFCTKSPVPVGNSTSNVYNLPWFVVKIAWRDNFTGAPVSKRAKSTSLWPVWSPFGSYSGAEKSGVAAIVGTVLRRHGVSMSKSHMCSWATNYLIYIPSLPYPPLFTLFSILSSQEFCELGSLAQDQIVSFMIGGRIWTWISLVLVITFVKSQIYFVKFK